MWSIFLVIFCVFYPALGDNEAQGICRYSEGDIQKTPNVIGEINTPIEAIPWHAGLYTQEKETWNYICGGSLLNSRIVLTAASCVDLLEPEDLQVSLGRYYRSWELEEPYTVKSNVTEIRIPGDYNGAATSYMWDLALLLLSRPVQFNSYILPIRQDPEIAKGVTQNSTAYMVAWGQTVSNGEEEETLLHRNLTIIDAAHCGEIVPRVMTIEKLCGTKDSGRVARSGDGGGALTTIDNDRHYLIGIVSVNAYNLTLFTNMSWPSHQVWLTREINGIMSKG